MYVCGTVPVLLSYLYAGKVHHVILVNETAIKGRTMWLCALVFVVGRCVACHFRRRRRLFAHTRTPETPTHHPWFTRDTKHTYPTKQEH